jgi:hypothetical protein
VVSWEWERSRYKCPGEETRGDERKRKLKKKKKKWVEGGDGGGL